jgi:pimeloyl-[acyl-carrier protein] synthase
MGNMTTNIIEQTEQYQAFCRGALANLYPLHHRLRAEDPVHWSHTLESWILTRYADVLPGLSDARLSANRMPVFMKALPEPMRIRHAALGKHFSLFFANMDPPEHTRFRGIASQSFTPKMVKSLAPKIQNIVSGLLDELTSKGELDAISDFAYPIPATVIAEMLGIPPEDRLNFGQWSRDLTNFLGASTTTLQEVADQAQHSLQRLTEYFLGLIEQRRSNPQQDLISSLIAVEEEGDLLNEEELVATCNFLLMAGHDTTTNLIGNSILALLNNPDELQKLKSDPGLIETAMEEFLRYESPLQRQTRVALDDFEIDGRCIRKGQTVLMLQGAANRDPEQFPDPDRLDIGRQDNKHVAFGAGIHFCLGASLARLEAQIAINTIVQRLSNIRLATDNPSWRQNVSFRGLKSLPIRFVKIV